MKALEILRDHDTEEKRRYLSIKDSSHPIDKASCIQLSRTLVKQAEKVLAGECPHEREFLGTERVMRQPRDWMTYYEEVGVYGKCKFCGE